MVLGAVVPTVDVSVTGDVTNGGSLGMVVFTGEIFLKIDMVNCYGFTK